MLPSSLIITFVPSITTVAGKLSSGLSVIVLPSCVSPSIISKFLFNSSILMSPSVPILPNNANFTCSSAFAFSVFSFAIPAFCNIPLSPLSAAIVTPTNINKTMMYRKLLMVSQ